MVAAETSPEREQPPAAGNKEGGGAARPSWPKKRRRLLLIIGGFAAALILSVLLYLILTLGKESTDDAQVDADLVPIAPRVAGQVVSIDIVENQRVEKDELLIQIDDRDYQARVAQASGELESARAQADAADAQVAVAEAGALGAFSEAQANLAGSNRSVSAAEAQLEQARATVVSRRADFKLAEVNLQRARDLRKANAIPQQQLDQAQAQRDSARAGVEAAQANVDAADQGLRRSQAQVSESEGRVVISRPVEANIAAARANAAYQRARVKSAEAALNLAELNLEWTRVVAPEDGVVSRISGYPGALLAVGQTVAQFVPMKKYVTANFKETQIGRMHAGQRAEVRVDTYGRTIRGRVESLAAGTGARFSLLPPENATGNFVKVAQRIPVRIALESIPEGMELRAGQSVVVTVYVSE
jgi:membrane fusion protein (multidrug efflux system)